jgi:hypothetical protein
LLYRLLCRYSLWKIYWNLRGPGLWYKRYLSLVVIITTLFRGTTCELGGFTSDISSKKRINISFLFTTANSVENNLGFSSLNGFLSMLKIILWFRFILHNYIYYKKSLVFQDFSLNYNISKIFILEPENESFNNIIELKFPSIIRFISSVLIIENIRILQAEK